MMNKKILALCMTVAIAFFMMSFDVSANNKGPADADEDPYGAVACVTSGCHLDVYRPTDAIVGISGPASATAGETGLTITITAELVGTPDTIGGILLSRWPVNSSIEDDGWLITADPNGNSPTPFNYNKNDLMSGQWVAAWTLTAPSTPGDYDSFAFFNFEGIGTGRQPAHSYSSVLTTSVSGVPEFPSLAMALLANLGVYAFLRRQMKQVNNSM